MQSIFRLPWSPGALDKPTTFKPIVDLPTAPKGKRKRMMDSSPRSSPSYKKLKQVDGGAVQGPPAQFRRGADSSPALQPAVLPTTTVNMNVRRIQATGSGLAASFRAFNPVPKTEVSVVDDKVGASALRTLRQADASPSSMLSAPPIATEPPAASPSPSQYLVMDRPGAQKEPTRQSPSGALDHNLCREQPSGPLEMQPPVNSAQCDARSKAKAKVSSDHLRAIIEAEINQAILLKHNELRLVEQEMAKCQVALEQIRRCQLIPFPGSQEPSLTVASHSAPALVAPAGLSVPQYPAPWGVTDGPYTRHYAKWLIPSSSFDPQAPPPATAPASPFPRDMRATRGSALELAPINTYSARASRNSTGRARTMVDPSSPTPSKDPLLIMRLQDKEYVKLYCSHCVPERSDFANVQGFLNHCRISHKLDFKSHEAAAIACGRVVHLDEAIQTPSLPSAREAAPKTAVEVSASDRPLIHPLAKALVKDRASVAALQQIVPRRLPAQDASRLHSPLPTNAAAVTFVPSNEAPHLSALLQKRGFAGNLASTVTNAKQKVDLSVYDDTDSEPDVQATKRSKTSRKGDAASARAPHSKPSSTVGASQPINRGVTSSTSAVRNVGVQLPLIHTPAMKKSPLNTSHSEFTAAAEDMGLSPHTADSNPGLVSDRDDDEDVDEEDAPSEHQRGGHHEDLDHDVMMVDVDDSDIEGGSVGRDSHRFCSENGQSNGRISC